MSKYQIVCTSNFLLKETQQLANFTQEIQLVTDVNQVENLNNMPYLLIDERGLSIRCNLFTPIYIQDIYARIITLRQNLEQELLIQALKIKNKPREEVIILDLTAGLAKDAILIAKYGYNITMVEQNPMLATIIYYAIQKNYMPNNAKIIFMNSLDYLRENDKNLTVDAIYLDPMFKHKKSAKAKKDMQLIQLIHEIENYNTDEILLFEQAMKTQTNRVVVKRDNKQQAIVSKPTPSFNKQGKTVRYDVYTHCL